MEKSRFERTVDILLKAFHEGTLYKGSPCGCAVGNMIASNMGLKVISKQDPRNINSIIPTWFDSDHNWVYGSWYDPDDIVEEGEQANSTGYSVKELVRIENAFESNTIIGHETYRAESEKDIIEDQFNGLMAVVDVLMEIDGIDTDTESDIKGMFNKELALDRECVLA